MWVLSGSFNQRKKNKAKLSFSKASFLQIVNFSNPIGTKAVFKQHYSPVNAASVTFSSNSMGQSKSVYQQQSSDLSMLLVSQFVVYKQLPKYMEAKNHSEFRN